MKALRIIFMTVLLFSVFSVTAFAEYKEDEVWDDFMENAPDIGIDFENGEELLSGLGIDSLISEILAVISGGSGDVFSFSVMLAGLAVLIALSESASKLGGASIGAYSSAGISLISSLLIFSRLSPICESVRASISELGGFFSGLIPILTGISAAGGGMNTASVQAVNMNLTLGIISGVFESLLLPIVFLLFALSLVSSVDAGGISSLAKGVKGFFLWTVGIGAAVIMAAVSMQSIVAGAQDGAYLRAAKHAASGMIPVVGGAVSGALGTLAGGLSYLKSTVGASGVLIIIITALPPLAILLLYRAALSICSSFLEFAGSHGGVRIYASFISALDALIALYSISTIVYISEIIIFIKSGVEVFG